jgi:hypothetical protein
MNNPKNLISLTLSNVSSVDSEVNLFSGNSTNASSSTDVTVYQSVEMIFVAGVQYQITGTDDGIFTNYFSAPAIADIDALMTDLNGGGLSGYAIFTYELNTTAPNYKIFAEIIDPLFIFSLFRSLTPTVTYNFTSKYNTIQGSTVIATTNSDLTYSELVNELINQPYIIDSISVFASTLAQASEQLKKVERVSSGQSVTKFNYPTIDPLQKQFSIIGIDANFSPSPVSSIVYTIKANETVTLFFYYKMIDQIEDIAKLEAIVPIQIQNKKTMKTETIIIIPMFELVGKSFAKTIVDKMSIKVIPREVTHDEIFNSFGGTDFKQL